jgi:RNA-directed DNA polymerase
MGTNVGIHPLIPLLDRAYRWLCQQRRHFPPNADVWHLRRHWGAERQRLLAELAGASFRFGPLAVITPATGEPLHLWGARDALVLKALALALGEQLSLSPRCVHVKGHGGLKYAVRGVQQHLGAHAHVLRTDVKGFYENIDQPKLLVQLAAQVSDPRLLDLLRQAVERTVERGGLYRDIRTGISRGCPLSPLLGALYLKTLDERLTRSELFYVRYMDDILVLAKTRWQLRRAVRTLNRSFDELSLAQAPDRTFIGRVVKEFVSTNLLACQR